MPTHPAQSTARRTIPGMLLAVALAAFAIVPSGTAALAAGETGSISGTVTSAALPGGVPDVEVIYRGVGQVGILDTFTDENGEYQFDDVPSGSYVVRFTPGVAGLAREFYDDATLDGLATTVEVFGGNAVTGIDAFLEAGNMIQGTLSEHSAPLEGLPDVRVTIRAVQDVDGKDAIFTVTDDNGFFSVPGLPDGQYLVYYDPQGVSDYVAAYYGDAATPVGATVASLSENEIFDASASLEAGGTISGNIAGVGSSADTDFMAEAWSLDSGSASWSLAAYADVDQATGDYVIHGLAAGSYGVRFSDLQWPANAPVFAPEYYNDKVSLPTATDVVVAAGDDTPNIDAVLTLTGPEITEPIATVERLSGSNRYATSAKIAESFQGTDGTVFIASGETFPDALSVGPVAAKQDAPLLLTQKNSLPSLVKAQIVRLQPSSIVVVGGTGAVSSAVFDELETLTETVIRIGGSNRYETSLNVASFGFDLGTNTAFFATGANFPDALSAASAAAKLGAPVILINGHGSTVDQPTRDLLASIQAVNLYVAGGTGVVSDTMATSLGSLEDVGFVQRLSGSNRYLTSLAVNQFFDTSDTVYLATGTGFADALSGAALAGSTGAPLYVVPQNCVPSGVLQAIADLHATTVVLLGGTGALSSNVAELKSC